MITTYEDRFKLYNCRDALVPALCLPRMWLDLKEAGLDGFYREVVHPLAQVILHLNRTGLYVDKVARERAVKAIDERLEEAQSFLNRVIGKEINVNGDDLSRFLYSECGLRNASRKSKRGTDEDSLRKLATRVPEIAPVVEGVLEIRSKRKLKNTFLNFEIAEDGRVKPSYRIGPATGRLACKKPNFQNIPAGPGRAVFCAPPGYRYIYSDFSQVELRILAILSQDESLLQIFREGRDIHDANARDLFQLGPEEKVSPRQRFFAKMFQYGINYGGSIETIKEGGSEMFHDVPLEVMEAAENRYFRAHPAILAFRKRIERQLKTSKPKMLRNAFGRPRIFFDRYKNALRQAYNFPMQSGAADLLNKKMIKLHKELSKREGTLVLQVHDSILVEAKEDVAEEVAEYVKEVLEEKVPEFDGYSFPAKVKIGRSWGEFE